MLRYDVDHDHHQDEAPESGAYQARLDSIEANAKRWRPGDKPARETEDEKESERDEEISAYDARMEMLRRASGTK